MKTAGLTIRHRTTRRISTGPKAARPANPHGFTLMEALVSLSLSSLVLVGALGVFTNAQHSRADAQHEWIAFTLAQTQLEMLSSAPTDHPNLADSVPDVVSNLGSDQDAQCDTGADGNLSTTMRVDELGQPRLEGLYTLCWKVTGGNPFGTLKNIRVVSGYPSQGERRHVLLQTIR